MKTLGEKLKEARQNKGLKQSDVAEKLGCAPTSLTNWENGKVNPSFDVLSKLCLIYEIAPLSLLNREYSYEDIVAIAGKLVPERSYEEELALAFSEPILARLLLTEKERQETERAEQAASFIKSGDFVNRFGGMLDKEQIAALMGDYKKYGETDADLLYAFHALEGDAKAALLSMVCGLLSDNANLQDFKESTLHARDFTVKRLKERREYVRRG